MTKTGQASLWLLSGLVCCLFLPRSAEGATLNVNCNAPAGQLHTISGALKLVNPQGPNTINISGTCNENLVIQGFQRLTLQAVPGASINDASGGTNPVLDVIDSTEVLLQGLTINGGSGSFAVVCEDFSLCRFQGNTIQSGGSGVWVVDESGARFNGDLIQGNGNQGLNISRRSAGHADNLSILNNGGAGVFLGFSGFFAGDNITIQGNANGVRAIDHSTLRLAAGTISGNGANGVKLEGASEATFQAVDNPITISGNGANGVQINDLSFARFQNGGPSPSVSVIGNGATDVRCNPQFSATRGVSTDLSGTFTTNCVEP